TVLEPFTFTRTKQQAIKALIEEQASSLTDEHVAITWSVVQLRRADGKVSGGKQMRNGETTYWTQEAKVLTTA
ncbi:hypothetical protein H0H92_005798, partial [Tricholoma furcatifolium]